MGTPDRDALRALHAAATPGPWWDQETPGQIMSPNYGPLCYIGEGDDAEADAALIVAMHSALLDLLDALDAAEAELTDARKVVAAAEDVEVATATSAPG